MLTFTFTCDDRDIALLSHAMHVQLERVETEMVLLRLARERPLTLEECNALPETLRDLPPEELRDQLDPWETLRMHYAYWVKKFNEHRETLNSAKKQKE